MKIQSLRALFAFLLTLTLIPAACGAGDGTSDADRMAQEHKHDSPAPSPAATTPPSQEVTAREVVYGEIGGKPLKGWLAAPKAAKGPLPGIVVIHEWWGLNDNIRHMAERLAGEGYTALAVDLYGGATADTPGKAQELMKAAMADKAKGEDNVRQAYAYLETKEKAPKIGVIGWCFGGGWSLISALLLPDKIDATVIYYGFLDTDKEKLSNLSMPVIGFFGEQDQAIPVASARDFEKTMKELGKPAEIHVYEGAGHAFANPSGENYRPEAAQDAWKKTVAFLAQHLGGGKG